MKAAYKKFDPKLHSDNDAIAKLTALDYLLSTGHYEMETSLEMQPELYKDCDFYLLHNGGITKRKVLVEAERKVVWTKEDAWQGWPTIDVPHRKKDSKSDLYVMVNKSCTMIAITLMKNVLEAPVSTKRTKYTENEAFFNVSLDKFKFYTKKKDKWSSI